ncbi:MAG: hypothetical protein H6812_01660 [Phycisphaeraceae bacterium]|nr:hypothetical protein [Phycisphaerales bacterium]MCB9841942.1 hypothetical protein [Phycisphaeraceae bacterium]
MSQNTRRATRAFGAVLITMGAWAASVSLTACADYPTNAHGPRINMWPGIAPTMIVRNESGSAVRIFPWIGKIDATDPSGASGFTRKHTFDVIPGCTDRVSLGSPIGATGPDGIVRFGILELDEHGRAPADHEARTRWFEFEQPHPYDLRITGEPGDLEYESIGEGGLVELAGAVGAG